MLIRCVALALVLSAAVCAHASAAVVSLTSYTVGSDDDRYDPVTRFSTLKVADPTGGSDDVTVTIEREGYWISGAAAGEGCRAEGERVRCDLPPSVPTFAIALGDGDDRVTVDGIASRGTVDGGAGHDTLRGGPGEELFLGSPGSDHFDGGGGKDKLQFVGPVPVRLDLAAAVATTAGEDDTFTAIESFIGSDGDDILRGGPGNDDLDGAAGHDQLEGGPGDDVLRGDESGDSAPAADRLSGGPGNDGLSGFYNDVMDGGEGDDVLSSGLASVWTQMDCGPGNDQFWSTSAAHIATGCERMRLGFGAGGEVIIKPVVTAGRNWRLAGTVHCDDSVVNRCPTRIDVRLASDPGKPPGRLLNRLRVLVPGADTKSFRIGLGSRGRRLLSRRGNLLVEIRVRTAFDFGRFDTLGVTLPV